eukprot:scaffold4976_cov161-Amphora_coffeaeformis.AAC.3
MLNAALAEDSNAIKVDVFSKDDSPFRHRVEGPKPPELSALSDGAYNTLVDPILEEKQVFKKRIFVVVVICFLPNIIFLIVARDWIPDAPETDLYMFLGMTMLQAIACVIWIAYSIRYIYDPTFKKIVEAYAPIIAKESYYVTYETSQIANSYLKFTKEGLDSSFV